MSDNNEYTHTLPTGTRIKDYEIEKVLGKGGFGITYLARDVNLDKKVAIKELLPDGIATRSTGMSVVAQTSSQEDDFRWAVDSFLKEARILAGFDHPNIVHVYRLFEEHHTAYMVMPFIEGVSLKQVVKNEKRLPYEDVNKIVSLLMDGLEVVHGANTLHRDIKPDNIIITGKGVPMLIDFGAARQQISGKTHDVTSIITPGYAPVEQYSTDAKYQGPWSDIYALAACTYFMITGKQPIPASERNDAVRNQQADPLQKLTKLAPAGYPQHFLEAVDAALQMSESLRPQSISDWRKQLAGEKTVAPPPMPPGSGSASSAIDDDKTRKVTGPSGSSIITDPPAPQPPGKKSKTALIASICVVIIVLLGVGGYLGWKALSGDPEVDNGVLAKLSKVEAFIESEKPRKAQDMLTTIESDSVPDDQKDRYHELSEEIDKLLKEGESSVAVRFEPSWAQTYLNGKKCGVVSGKIKIKGLGNHSLRISADGYQSRTISFEAKEIGGLVSLDKVTLSPSSKTNTVVRVLDKLSDALDDKDYDDVLTYSGQLRRTSVPKHLMNRATALQKQADKFIAENKWMVSLKFSPASARIYLNGSRVYPKYGKFQGKRSGSQTLKLVADGYEDKTRTFSLSSDGRPIDLGMITLTARKAGKPTISLTKEAAIRHAKNYIIQGNSKYAIDSQMDYLADHVFWGEDQKNQTKKADIRAEVTKHFQRWKTRTFTIDHNSANAQLSKTGKSWVISVNYSYEWKDKIFTLKGKRQGLFAVMDLSGKTRIVAHKSNVIGKDERTFDDKALITELKLFNKRRLSAGDSEGGESVFAEASYYSNQTEYYGARILTRVQIMQKIRESRAKDSTRLYIAKDFSDFTNMNVEDKTNRTFSFKCVTEVHKSSGRSTRTERVKVRFENGRPYVISVRY